MGTLSLVALAFAAGIVYREYTRTLEQEMARAANLAHALEQQTARTFQAIDLTLAGIADALAVVPGLRPHGAAFQDTLRRKLETLPFVRNLYVIGVDGFPVHDTNYPRTPRVSAADREYFRVHRDDPAFGLYISTPLVSRAISGAWFISVSRRVSGRDGRFAGVAVAAVEPLYFEHFYRTLHLSEGDSIALFSSDGTLLFRSPRSEGVIGRSFADMQAIRRSRAGDRSGSFRVASLFDGVPRIFGYRAVESVPLVVVVGRAEGPLLAGWRRFAIWTFAGAAGVIGLGIAVYVLLARQIRQRAEFQERLAHAQRLEALGRMTGGIAHDFNNLLGVIATNLHGLRRRAASERLPVSVDAAMRAVSQGSRLVDQLLAFARRQELTVKAHDANGLLHALMPLLTQAVGPFVIIRTDLAADLWPCLIDETQFNSAVLNLIVNARDAMPEGRGVIRITTRNHPDGHTSVGPHLSPGDYVRVTVTDNGTGMPASVLRRATEPLYTTKGEGLGTGLGLSQAYGFARQVGGDLLIESTVGVGTSVHLLFRRAPERAPDARAPENDRLRDERSRRSPGELRAESP